MSESLEIIVQQIFTETEGDGIELILQSGVPGEKGDKGDTGNNGATGEQGIPGEAATITVGTVTTGDVGTDVMIDNSGANSAAVLNFTIPKGADGITPTVAIGTTTTGDTGTEAVVENVGTNTDVILNFTVPKGDIGASGASGNLAPPWEIDTDYDLYQICVHDGYLYRCVDAHTSAASFDTTKFALISGGNPVGTIISVLTKTSPSGYLKANGAAISRTAYANLINHSFITIPTTGNKTSGSATIMDIPTVIDMAIGMHVEGEGIPSGATITSINNLTSITLSAALTFTATSGAFTVYPYGNGDGSTTVNLPDLRGEHIRAFDDSRNADSTGYNLATTNGSEVITSIPDTSFMFIGMSISGAGIPVGATVASITSSTSITMSTNATASSTKLVTFMGRRFGSWQDSDNKLHTHPYVDFSYPGSNNIGSGSGSYWTSNVNKTTGSSGGSEARGRNYAFPVYIKY